MQGFLVWDAKDERGARAGQGAYIRVIEPARQEGRRAERALRTGLLRRRD